MKTASIAAGSGCARLTYTRYQGLFYSLANADIDFLCFFRLLRVRSLSRGLVRIYQPSAFVFSKVRSSMVIYG